MTALAALRMFCRPVVLLEQDHLRPDIVALELDDVADVRASEGVDRLVRVADDGEGCRTEVSAPLQVERQVVLLDRAGEFADERVLRVVGVLVLIDQDVPEAALVQGRHLGEGTEQIDRLPDQVVEVEGVRRLQAAGVLAEDVEEDPLLRVIEVRPAGVRLHVAQLVLELRDLAGDPADGEAEGVGIEIADDALDQGARVGRIVDGEVLAEAEVLGLAAQDAHAGGVEGGDPHAL